MTESEADAVIRNAQRVLDTRQFPPDDVWPDLLKVAKQMQARIAAVEAWAMKNEIAAPPLDWAGLGAILHPLASPTPTGPEPARCEHMRTEAHYFGPVDADNYCPGPPPPKPTEETP